MTMREKLDLLTKRLLEQGESCWTVVHEDFMARDLTRDDLQLAWREADPPGTRRQPCATWNNRDVRVLLVRLRRSRLRIAGLPGSSRRISSGRCGS